MIIILLSSHCLFADTTFLLTLFSRPWGEILMGSEEQNLHSPTSYVVRALLQRFRLWVSASARRPPVLGLPSVGFPFSRPQRPYHVYTQVFKGLIGRHKLKEGSLFLPHCHFPFPIFLAVVVWKEWGEVEMGVLGEPFRARWFLLVSA